MLQWQGRCAGDGERIHPRLNKREVYWIQHCKGVAGRTVKERLSTTRRWGEATVTGQSKGVWGIWIFPLFCDLKNCALLPLVGSGLWLFWGGSLTEPCLYSPPGSLWVPLPCFGFHCLSLLLKCSLHRLELGNVSPTNYQEIAMLFSV